jgi:hypothetical protein
MVQKVNCALPNITLQINPGNNATHAACKDQKISQNILLPS